MRYLVAFAVSGFPPFEQTDVNQLAEENLAYEGVDWARIAEVSAEVVESQPDAEGDPASWLDAGRIAGLNDRELWAFESLLAHPIDVAGGE